MNRDQALKYVSFAVDDTLCRREPTEMPPNARLVGYQAGFEPVFVAVWSYLETPLSDDEAEDLATDLLTEIEWFADGPCEADYII